MPGPARLSAGLQTNLGTMIQTDHHPQAFASNPFTGPPNGHLADPFGSRIGPERVTRAIDATRGFAGTPAIAIDFDARFPGRMKMSKFVKMVGAAALAPAASFGAHATTFSLDAADLG